MLDFPLNMEIGHELIHARKIMQGKSDVKRTGEQYLIQSYLPSASGFTWSERIAYEEYMTTFVHRDINENMLRREHGIPMRVLYEDPEAER